MGLSDLCYRSEVMRVTCTDIIACRLESDPTEEQHGSYSRKTRDMTINANSVVKVHPLHITPQEGALNQPPERHFHIYSLF